jgi:hypothetical protein
VERAVEGDERCAARRIARELDRAFDRLGAGVGEEDALLARAGGDAGEPLAERGHRLVIEIGAADVQEFRRGVVDRRDDVWMRVPRRGHGDPGHEVEVAIPVHVLDDRPLTAGNDEWVLLDVRRRGEGLVALDERARLGAGRWGDDPGIVAGTAGARYVVRGAREP